MAKLLTQEEKYFRDQIAEESLDLGGSVITFYSINPITSETDPLYNEPGSDNDWDATAYDGVKCFFQKPEKDLQENEGGIVEGYNGQVYFAKGQFDSSSFPMPRQGDVVKHPSFGYFELLKCSRDGYYADQQDAFVTYACEIERSQKNLPERKLKKLGIV